LVPANSVDLKARVQFSRILSFRTRFSVYVDTQKIRVRPSAVLQTGDKPSTW
jgi:hypothetical protein